MPDLELTDDEKQALGIADEGDAPKDDGSLTPDEMSALGITQEMLSDGGGAPATQEEQSGLPDWVMALTDGLTLNNAGELGNAVMKTGSPDAIARKFGPSHEIGGMAPTYAGDSPTPDMEALYALAEDSLGGKAAQLGGNAITGVAAGGLAPAGWAGQAAAGGATGALSAGGQTSWDDALAVLGGGALGAGLGALGGYAAGGLSKLRGWLNGSPGEQGVSSAIQGNAGRLLDNIKFSDQTTLTGAVGQAGKYLGIKAAQSTIPAAVAQGVTGAAYATFPTMAWGIEAVLSSGNSGLRPEEEQQLTEALMSGDKQKIIATNFKLQQRNPAYAKSLQDTLESVNSEDRS